MDILADIFYISAKMGNFTKMGYSTMQIFYENGLVDNLIQFGVTVTEACRRQQMLPSYKILHQPKYQCILKNKYLNRKLTNTTQK